MNSLKSHNAQKANKDKYTNTELARLRCHPTLLWRYLCTVNVKYFFSAFSFEGKILPQLHNARGIIFLRVDELAVNRRKILYERREACGISRLNRRKRKGYIPGAHTKNCATREEW
jgi:hypothetical protein